MTTWSGAGHAPEDHTGTSTTSLPAEDRRSEPNSEERHRLSDFTVVTRSGAGRTPEARAWTSATSIPSEERSMEPDSGECQRPFFRGQRYNEEQRRSRAGDPVCWGALPS